MKQFLLLLTLVLSTTIFGQRFSYDLTYEGSNGDSLAKTEGHFKISRVRKTRYGLKKGVLRIKTDSFTLKEKVVFLHLPYDNDTFFDIGLQPKDRKFDRIIGTPETMSFFLNDTTVYYLQMKTIKPSKT